MGLQTFFVSGSWEPPDSDVALDESLAGGAFRVFCVFAGEQLSCRSSPDTTPGHFPLLEGVGAKGVGAEGERFFGCRLGE